MLPRNKKKCYWRTLSSIKLRQVKPLTNEFWRGGESISLVRLLRFFHVVCFRFNQLGFAIYVYDLVHTVVPSCGSLGSTYECLVDGDTFDLMGEFLLLVSINQHDVSELEPWNSIWLRCARKVTLTPGVIGDDHHDQLNLLADRRALVDRGDVINVIMRTPRHMASMTCPCTCRGWHR